jgi:electron transfer flavoprotein beta subunit
MKLAVCVKHVPDGRLHIDAASKRIDRSGPGELNTFDKNAVEEALRIKGDGAAEIVVVSMGPKSAVESLRTALALGADRAVLVSDAAAEGSDLVATTRVLAGALAREGADLILFGQQTSDGGGGVLPAAVADRLHLPLVSQAAAVVVHDQSVQVTRQTEYGDEVIEVPLPAIVAVSDSINEPRYTSLKGMMGAKKKPLEMLSIADIGVEAAAAGAAGSLTSVLGVAEPSARLGATKIEDDGGSGATAIVEYLAQKQLA